MRRNLTVGVLLTAAMALAAAPAMNFSGKWEIPGDRESRGRATILTLNQVGNEVTGTYAVPVDAWTNSPLNNSVRSGRVEGDGTLAFYVWTGTDQPAKVHFRGTMQASGGEVVFTVTGLSGGAARQITARRVR